MSDNAFDLNHPVHLARRDVFYEQAGELIKELSARKNPDEKKEIAEKALFFFHEARQHARAVGRSGKKSAGDLLFLDFLDTAVDNTQSITRMLRRQQAASTEEGPLGRFLESTEISTKMAAHYRRCAAHALKGLLLVLQHADKPYEQLRETALTQMSTGNRTRYEKARSHLSDRLKDQVTCARTSGSAL